jgi:hypothetical protein
MQKRTLLIGISALAAAGCAAVASGPQAINWDKIPSTRVALFHPGQSSYQWLRSDAHKGAAKEVQRGDSCVSCHDDAQEEQMMGSKILKGKHPLEPETAALKGRKSHLDVQVQAAYDEKNAYLRFQWKADQPGTEHVYFRFDGKEWKKYGDTVWSKGVKEGKQPALYESRLSVMLDDGKVPGFAQQGCWQTCHNGMNDMPQQATAEEVAANPLLKATKKTDVRKFLPATRHDPSTWKSGKSVEEIAKQKDAGEFLDLMQWRGGRSAGIGMADDGYVLDSRESDAGKNMWAGNFDSKSKLPKFMWDEKKAGYKAIRAEQLHKAEHFLDPASNAVPFAADAGWKEGDLLPGNTISRSHAAGSAADNNAISTYKDGQWTLLLIRPLALANKDDKALKPGAVYNVGFAIHDGNIDGRGHFVSFAKTFGIGTKADIQALKLN